MKKHFFFLMTLMISLSASAATKSSPSAALKSVLACPAAHGAPEFYVVTKNKKLYLAVKTQTSAQIITELVATNVDMGYMVYEATNSASLGQQAKYFSNVTVLNNQEEIEDSSKAIVTGGYIRVQDRAERQRCVATGKTRVSP